MSVSRDVVPSHTSIALPHARPLTVCPLLLSPIVLYFLPRRSWYVSSATWIMSLLPFSCSSGLPAAALPHARPLTTRPLLLPPIPLVFFSRCSGYVYPASWIVHLLSFSLS